jgi:hypothetical protein
MPLRACMHGGIAYFGYVSAYPITEIAGDFA